MAYNTKYTAVLEGNIRQWTINVKINGFSGEKATLSIIRDLVLTWEWLGSDETKGMWASSVPLSFIDEGGSLFDDLNDTTKSNQDFRIEITDGSERTWTGLANLATTEKTLFPDIETEVTQVYAYCGLSDVSDQTEIDTSQATLHEIVKGGTYDLIPHDIRYIQGWRPENTGTGAIMDLMRLEDRALAESDREDLLARITGGFHAGLWQTFAGEWRLQHLFSIGESIGSSTRAHQLFDGSSISEQGDDHAENNANLTATDFDGQASENQAVRLRELRSELDPGINIGALFPMRNGNMEAWDGPELLGWDGDATQESTTVQEGSFSAKLDQTTIFQNLMWGRQGTGAFPKIEFWYHQEARGSTVSQDVRYRLYITPYGSGTTHYLDSAGDWQTTTQDINAPVSDGSWSKESVILPNDDWPVAGVLTFEILGDDGTDHLLYIDNASGKWVDIDDESTTQDPVGQRLRARNNGRSVELSLLPDGFKKNSWLLSVNDGSQWTAPLGVDGVNWSTGEPSNSVGNSHLVELLADSRSEDRSREPRLIEGTLLGLYPPEQSITYSSRTYRVHDAIDMDLVEETTTGTWIEKLKTFN